MLSEQKRFLIIAFISGVAVTAMEISAARLMAPYFGTSVFVWTNIIGVVLTSLSLGYYIGGKLSERRPELSLLLNIIFIAGIFCLSSPWLVRPLVALATPANVFAGEASFYILVGSFLFSALLFGIPIALLGMTSPFLIKLSAIRTHQMGSTSGSIFAWSTLGSIIGTFLPTLLLIPFFGTRATITLFASLLVLLGSFGFTSHRKRFLGFLLVLVALCYDPGTIRSESQLLEERESVHQYIRVIGEPDGSRYMRVNEGLGVQSIYHPNQISTGSYFDSAIILPYLVEQEEPTKVLLIGLAGGTVARGMHAEFGDRVALEAVEIDPVMTELGKKYFGLGEVPIVITHTDGRVFLETSSATYDLILVDAYQNEVYIPWTMTTEQFWQSVKNHLSPHGVVALNMNASSDDSKLFSAVTNTVAKIFSHTYASKVHRTDFNYLVTASSESLSFDRLLGVKDGGLASMAQKIQGDTEPIIFSDQKLVLTDDRAPVEFLTDEMIVRLYK